VSRDGSYLRHIGDAIDKILAYTADGQEAFRANPMAQDAVIRNFEIIGEAVKNLSTELKGEHDDVPWRNIGAMRDKLIHHYFGVDLDVVWDTVTNVLPANRIYRTRSRLNRPKREYGDEHGLAQTDARL
jgi:uncharacterized protein with HEPN domain